MLVAQKPFSTASIEGVEKGFDAFELTFKTYEATQW
ncbi:MAG: hypothetical protein JWR87_384 [Segetibacter sp.]|jgi:hypothetical protein|nr:hypothetical protein [Segetibacter sp.]